MLTIHVADRVFGAPGGGPAEAVAVDGGVIVAIGAYDEVAGARPQARVRRWPGLLVPGLVNSDAVALLEAAYHPDPREADTLGTEPLTGQALVALGLDDTRWGASARRGLQRMLGHGTTAVAGPFTRPEVRTAVARSGLRVRDRRHGPEGGTPSLDPLATRPLSEVLDGELSLGAPADFAVFDVPAGEPPARALREHGAGTCVATVLGGRLVFRRR
ncbi:hypothetical protein ACFU5O_10880 [Streptomyces sp. NPDC057445]|uniref:hypothetical protein n=1 Tax=Streptomyces sp. NPDC057445 TaxID=3346136 RepID=UPI0036BCF374